MCICVCVRACVCVCVCVCARARAKKPRGGEGVGKAGRRDAHPLQEQITRHPPVVIPVARPIVRPPPIIIPVPRPVVIPVSSSVVMGWLSLSRRATTAVVPVPRRASVVATSVTASWASPISAGLHRWTTVSKRSQLAPSKCFQKHEWRDGKAELCGRRRNKGKA